MRFLTTSLMFGAALLPGGQAIAQTPPPAAVRRDARDMPFFIPYGPSITADRAAKIVAVVLAEASKHPTKARTAARFRRASRLFYNAYETGHGYVQTLDPGLVASPGGFPLVENGKLIGALGCSGGTGDQDATVCGVRAASFNK
jgi:hypothetical protein